MWWPFYFHASQLNIVILSIIFSLDCFVVQAFGSTEQEEVLSGASIYAICFVILAVGVASVQFIGVSLYFTGNIHQSLSVCNISTSCFAH